jgi:hypothetical protein
VGVVWVLCGCCVGVVWVGVWVGVWVLCGCCVGVVWVGVWVTVVGGRNPL